LSCIVPKTCYNGYIPEKPVGKETAMISNIHSVDVFPSQEEITEVVCNDLTRSVTVSFAGVTFFFDHADQAQAFITSAQNAFDNRKFIKVI